VSLFFLFFIVAIILKILLGGCNKRKEAFSIFMMNIQKKVKKIMSISDKEKREVALRTLANELGCSLSST